MINKNRVSFKKHGFTIVELLVVIVIIGILAAITIVSYSGISNKAIAATIQTDLANSSKKLKLYQAVYGSYPTLDPTTKCPTAPVIDDNYCLKTNSAYTYTYTSDGATFILVQANTSATIIYTVTDGLIPYLSTPTPITAVAAITGTTQVSQTLTAGAVSPAGATVTYQWQSATTSGGTYTNIPGATASTYAVSPSVMNKYIKVVATGTGAYIGTQISAATASAIAIDSNWLAIGTQTWAKANLNVGTMITGTAEQTNNSVIEKYCYNNGEAGCTTYDGFYQWNEAMQYVNTEGARGICSAGSHIPSDNDWKILEMQLGMTQLEADKLNVWRGTNQGTQLKPGGSSGLNMPLAGLRNTDGSFIAQSSTGYLWSSSESSTRVWNRFLEPGSAGVGRSMDDKAYGFPVRCVGN